MSEIVDFLLAVNRISRFNGRPTFDDLVALAADQFQVDPNDIYGDVPQRSKARRPGAHVKPGTDDDIAWRPRKVGKHAKEEDFHTCHFCGTYVSDVNGVESSGRRHWLRDCRPDLVPHPPGELCTWPAFSDEDVASDANGYIAKANEGRPDCYAYYNDDLPKDHRRTPNHTHFYPADARV